MRYSAIIITRGPRITVKTDCLVVGNVITGLMPHGSPGTRLTNFAQEFLDAYIAFCQINRGGDYEAGGNIVPKGHGFH